LQDGDARAQQRRELLIEKQKIVCLDASAAASAAAFGERGEPVAIWRRDREDFEAFALESRAHFIRRDRLDRARHNLAPRRS